MASRETRLQIQMMVFELLQQKNTFPISTNTKN